MQKIIEENGFEYIVTELDDGRVIKVQKFLPIPASDPDPQPEPATLDQVYEQNLDIMEGSVTTYEQNLQILDMLDKLGGTK